MAYSNEPYGEGLKQALVGKSQKYGVTMNSFALSSDTNNGVAMGQVIADSPVNVWIMVFNLFTPVLYANITASIKKRDVHFIFSETMISSEVNRFDADTKAALTGSIVIKAQGYRSGYDVADALLLKVCIGTPLPKTDARSRCSAYIKIERQAQDKVQWKDEDKRHAIASKSNAYHDVWPK